MQVTELKNEKLAREYSVRVDAKTIEGEIEKQLKTVGAKAKIPGFRPGHVPVNVLKQRYGKSVMGEVLENTVNKTSQEVIKEKELKPALPAQIKITSFEEGKDLEFTMALEVMPVVPAITEDKVKIERYTYEVPEAEVKEALERVAESNQALNELPADAKAEKGHTVKIDFVGYLDGEAFEGGTANGVNLALGSNTFIPGFEEQLEGTKAGDELTVKVSFPEDYHKEDLRGKPTEFKVKVHAVQEPVKAELNDEFAKKLGLESMEKLEGIIRQQIERELNQGVRSYMKKQLFDQLDKQCKFEVPARMLELEFDAIWKQVEQAKEQGDETLKGKDEKKLKKEYEEIAERRVRLGLLLSDISSKNKIQITQEELSAAIMEQARMFPGQEQKVFDYYRSNPQHLDEIRGPILEEKAVDYLLDKVTIKDKDASVETIRKREWEEDNN